ncbi:MAG: bifunctional hydroxymethylpyrimidine kinase/phosphomethylpyrimidine kinase [Legionellales bacterium]|nr:bifunctional hydroxymethylpyrimidine kinase/phosphomethylpyrimidine kinase [Legionellales bacterium]
MWHKCLSIAGFDGSGGAGIQADLKTFSALGCYGMTVLTALPIQNTQGVRRCYELPLPSILDQLEAIFDDITPDSIKIGMLFQREIVEMVALVLKERAQGIPIVLDPVMVAKSGDDLLLPDAIVALIQHLIPMATLITPNLAEAATLTKISTDMPHLAHRLLELGANAVLLKGGHAEGSESNDLFVTQTESPIWLKSPRIKTHNTHGTGCTLSAAIAANLAKGFSLFDACSHAKTYLFGAILAAQHISVGQGHGPVDHLYALRNPTCS